MQFDAYLRDPHYTRKVEDFRLKNHIDMLIFHESYLYDSGYIVPQASQSSL